MTQHPVELILVKQLASYLATPIFLVDPDGTLLYYNEPAEGLLGCRFDETGEMGRELWGAEFRPTDSDGAPIEGNDLPLAIALREGRPVHDELWIVGLDGVVRHLNITALPLRAQGGRDVGAVAVFWQAPT